MDATQALESHVAGDPNAASQLLPLVYDRLRALAATYMHQERSDHSFSATDLVHEAYVRLIDNTRMSWQGKTHFFAMAARQMRRVLVDAARAHQAQKRGGDLTRVTLDDNAALSPGTAVDFMALNEAIQRLSELSARQTEVVELRFFGGLSIRETAYVLGVSERTVTQDWTMARAWLLRELSYIQGK
jgi:RNA polymerase sigma factor (TIGR02999 family)